MTAKNTFDVPTTKLEPIREDFFKLAFVAATGIVIPSLLFKDKTFSTPYLWFSLVGICCFFIAKKLNVNITIFNNFTGNRMPYP